DHEDAAAKQSLKTDLDNRRDANIVANDARLDAAVGAVAHPAAQAEPARPAHHPGAVADPLYPAGDAQPHAPHGQLPRELPYSNSRITWSTARLSPGLARSLATRPSRSARSTFSIFIASTTTSGSPALTSWPSPTTTAVNRPGIGDSTWREVSAAIFAGIIAASSAARGASTRARRITPRCMSRKARAGRRSICTVIIRSAMRRCSSGSPGRH